MIRNFVRENILQFCDAVNSPTTTTSSGEIILNRNENPYNTPYNRFPDAAQTDIRETIAKLKGVKAECVLATSGIEEAVDLTYRIFCEPTIDNVVAIAPTSGEFERYARLNDIEYRAVPLEADFSLSAEKLLARCDENTKVIWLCSPNNPTGNSLNRDEMLWLADSFEGIVVVDETYCDFARQPALIAEAVKRENLISIQSMNAAWACAGLGVGFLFANEKTANIYNKVRPRHNINAITQEAAHEVLREPYEAEKWVRTIVQERTRLMSAFRDLPICKKIYPTEANFFLTNVHQANDVTRYLAEKGIKVKNCSNLYLCTDCLRITVGTKRENTELLAALR